MQVDGKTNVAQETDQNDVQVSGGKSTSYEHKEGKEDSDDDVQNLKESQNKEYEWSNFNAHDKALFFSFVPFDILTWRSQASKEEIEEWNENVKKHGGEGEYKFRTNKPY